MSNNFFELISALLIPLIILIILVYGLLKKIPVYETFVEGAKEGVKVGLGIIPYLVAIITAVSMFRASGAIDLLTSLFGNFFNSLNIPVDVLPHK